jgi:sec-independent protein translocase protein TatB
MFDIGWGEFFLIGVVALIVVGPKELPGLFRTVGQWTGKARGMAREFQRSLEQAANESGMNEVSQSLKSLEGVNLRSPTKTARNLATKAMTPSEPATDPKPEPTPEPTAATAPEPAAPEGKSAAS